ncbi:unnamed protein product [Albugo candida]|uniref:Uncharacterized protein n=1 Tax=Albugo candida TaxID=65357 RepID=A0A024G6Y0_9STRA|nr:unnamed protein product [Albugo candida]|eukprot:CCI42388.1 unnamed protein product [Albugo candida]
MFLACLSFRAEYHSTMSTDINTGFDSLPSVKHSTNSLRSTHKTRRHVSSHRLRMPPTVIAADVTSLFSHLGDPFITNFAARMQNESIRQFSYVKADHLHREQISHDTVEYVYKMCSSIQLRASVNQIVDVLESTDVKNYVTAMKMTLGTNFVGGQYLFRQFRPLKSDQLEYISAQTDDIEPSLIKVQAMRLQTKSAAKPQDLYFGTCTQRLEHQKRAIVAWKTIPKIVHEKIVKKGNCLCLQDDVQSIGITFDIQTNKSIKANLTQVLAYTTARFRSKKTNVTLNDIPPATIETMTVLVNSLYNLDHVTTQRKLGDLVVHPESVTLLDNTKCAVCSKRSRWYRRTTCCGVCRSTTCSKCTHVMQVWPRESNPVDTQVCKLCMVRAEMEPANETFLPSAFAQPESDYKKSSGRSTATSMNFDDMLLSTSKIEKRLMQNGRGKEKDATISSRRINAPNITSSMQCGRTTRSRSHSSCADLEEISRLYSRGIASVRPTFHSVQTTRSHSNRNGANTQSGSFNIRAKQTKQKSVSFDLTNDPTSASVSFATRDRAVSYQNEPLSADFTSGYGEVITQHPTKSIRKQLRRKAVTSSHRPTGRDRKPTVLQRMCQMIASRLNCQNVFIAVVESNGLKIKAFTGIKDQRLKLRTDTRFEQCARNGKPFVVKDTNMDQEWKPRDASAVDAIFVLGIPLQMSETPDVALLCAFDSNPRSNVSAEEYQMMESAAKLAKDVMECARNKNPALE